ncbi:MAG: hypothetical protein V2J51_00830 [Erythrobacter sp.]|jgi:hypothetical protein|nr:hypothetical protein [Erythrobacter sp.]
MTFFLALAALVTVQDSAPTLPSAPAEVPPVTEAMRTLGPEARAALRCAAAVSLVAHGQSIGNEAANKWPPVGESGREFFVRSMAQLMDQTGLDRAGISALAQAEAQRLSDGGEVDAIMPACLLMLDAAAL